MAHKEPRCANPECKTPGRPATCTLTVILEDGSDVAGTTGQARATYCHPCAGGVLEAFTRQAAAQLKALT